MDKKITVEKAGVAEYSENQLCLNSEDIVAEIMNKVKMVRPKQNYMGAFAARVTMTIELLGDLEGQTDG